MDCSTQILLAFQNEEPNIRLNHFWLQVTNEKVEKWIECGLDFYGEQSGSLPCIQNNKVHLM